MQAVIYRDYGDPSVLSVADLPIPDPAQNEIVIRVHAAGVNPIDARLRSGEMKGLLPGGFPRVPGYDVAGVVETQSARASFERGDRVLAYLDHVYGGGYAEFAVCTHDSVAPIPDAMPFTEAAGLPLAGSTALQSLRDEANLKSGDRVLVNGATGGVGAFAVQIAVASGATVTAVASGQHEEFARSLGAEEFINYEQENFAERDRHWNVIFDAAGKSSFTEVRSSLAPDGTYVTTEPSFRGLLVTMMTWPMKKQGKVMLAKSRGDDLRELVRLYAEEQLKVHVARSFPLDAAAEAHRVIENETFCGKLVLEPKNTTA